MAVAAEVYSGGDRPGGGGVQSSVGGRTPWWARKAFGRRSWRVVEFGPKRFLGIGQHREAQECVFQTPWFRGG